MKFFKFTAVLVVCLLAQSTLAATFSLSPSTVTNLYRGLITLQIAGLNNGETVTVQRFVDANANGVVDAGDFLSQAFPLTDNQGPTVLAGVTNINVPGDLNSANGTITAQLNSVLEDFASRLVGQYIYVVSSPSGRFAPVTATLAVTPSFTGQSISGAVTCNGTNVSDAIILIFKPKSGSGDGGGFNPAGGAIGNNSGGYTLKLAPGSYQFAAFKHGFVTDVTKPATVTLTAGGSLTANLALLPATTTISGAIVDAANPNIGLPGIFLGAQSSSGLFSIAATSTNGAFVLGVTANQWGFGEESQDFDVVDYVPLSGNNAAGYDTTKGPVTGVALTSPKATAFIYGTVRDAQNNPLTAVQLYGDNGQNGGGPLTGDATTDQNGNYVMAVNSGLWSPGIDGGQNRLLYPNYVFSAGPAWTSNNGGPGTTVTDGSATEADFIGILATNIISGSLVDGSGHAITNVQIYANANINGTSFNQSVNTDVNGNYSMNVGPGSWSVGVNCCGGGSCNNGLPSNDACPNNITVNISNNNGVANFVAASFPYQINGALKDSTGNPIPNVQIYAFATINGNNFNQVATTDGDGNYSIGVGNGSWTVGVNCCTGNNCYEALPVGYACPNQQTINISNHNATANFVSSVFPDVITGTLTDNSGSPIPNVMIIATATINSINYNQSGITDANGAFSISVLPGQWNVFVNCCSQSGCQNGLPSAYRCPNNDFVNVSTARSTVNFVAPASDSYAISGQVMNSGNTVIPSVIVGASAPGQPTVTATTDSNGVFTLYLTAGTWFLEPVCSSLAPLGYACPVGEIAQVSYSSSGNNFIVSPCGPLAVTTQRLSDAVIGSNYIAQVVSSGCNPPFNWTLTPGSLLLPQGLLLSSNGVISGIPVAAGTNYLSVRVTDGKGATADQLFSLAAIPPLMVGITNLPNATLNVPYTAQLGISGGSGGIFGSVSGNFPPGLQLQGDTIHGTPTALGTFQFTYQIIDNSLVTTAQATYALVVTQPNLQITTTNISGAVAGQFFSFQLFASGGTAPYIWAVPLGSQPLPADLTLSPGGLISGIPQSPGVSTVLIRVTDTNLLSTTAPVQISIGTPLTLSIASPLVPSKGQFQFTANAPTGRVCTIQYSLALPNWSTLFATNPSVTPFTFTDSTATNQFKFYRLLLLPP